MARTARTRPSWAGGAGHGRLSLPPAPLVNDHTPVPLWNRDLLSCIPPSVQSLTVLEPATAVVNKSPVKMLTSWREITDALELKHDEKSKVKSLNERFNGPIPKPPKGGQPIVQRDVLIAWWNKLAVQQQEAANRRDGAELSAKAQHNYGRKGTVAPELGGTVKKRRAHRKR